MCNTLQDVQFQDQSQAQTWIKNLTSGVNMYKQQYGRRILELPKSSEISLSVIWSSDTLPFFNLNDIWVRQLSVICDTTQISKLSVVTKLQSIFHTFDRIFTRLTLFLFLSQWHVKWPIEKDLLSEQLTQTQPHVHFYVLLAEKHLCVYSRRPRRPPFLLVESDGIGVTSSE